MWIGDYVYAPPSVDAWDGRVLGLGQLAAFARWLGQQQGGAEAGLGASAAAEMQALESLRRLEAHPVSSVMEWIQARRRRLRDHGTLAKEWQQYVARGGSPWRACSEQAHQEAVAAWVAVIEVQWPEHRSELRGGS